MRIVVLISGLLRSFKLNYKRLIEYLHEYEYDIYLCTSKNINSDDKYLSSNTINLEYYDKIKGILYIDDDIKIYDKEYNHLSQNWYKFKLLSKIIDKTNYDIVIKLRPDLHINDLSFNISNIINDNNTINIPRNNDIFTKGLFDNHEYINDQLAVFNISLLNKLENFYDYIENLHINYNLPFVSEILFYKYLEINNISINRITINYKLILSNCNIIAICGDSGSGKTTISKLIEPLLPNTDLLILETDRYHKWERGNINYNTYTHLNPYANNIEKMTDDLYNLKIGENVYSVDYDHNTGKFTPVQTIENKTNVILCGLHTLYNDKINSILDIKVFIDTDRELIKKWKIERDVNKRGYTCEQVLNNIIKREPDYNKYIITQKANANVIIKYYSHMIDYSDIKLLIKIRKDIINTIPNFILEQTISIIDNWLIINVDNNINILWNNIINNIQIDNIKLYNGYNGFIQRLFFYFIYENK